MRSLRKYAHILFIICVTVLAIRRISYTTQLNYIKRTFFPRSNYSNSLDETVGSAIKRIVSKQGHALFSNMLIEVHNRFPASYFEEMKAKESAVDANIECSTSC